MVRLCAYFNFFAFSIAVAVGYDCSNEAVGCTSNTYSSYLLSCYINSNDTQLIKSGLKYCSQSNRLTSLQVAKQYVSEELGNLIIDIDLPSNIRQLYFYQYSSQYHDYIRLTTSTFNYALTYMYSSEITKIESSNFFNYFVELKTLDFNRNLNSEQIPSFTDLHKLTLIRARIHVSIMPILNPSMVSGLENLVYLDLGYSNFERIEKNSFQNTSLTYLSLYICHGETSNLGEFEVPPGGIQIGVSTGGNFNWSFP